MHALKSTTTRLQHCLRLPAICLSADGGRDHVKALPRVAVRVKLKLSTAEVPADTKWSLR